MIYFSLPNCYNNVKLNEKIYEYMRNPQNKDKIFDQIKFISAEKNFPYCYHNGNYNNNHGKLMRWADYFVDANKQPSLANRINLSNIFIDDDDFDDCMLEVILNAYECGSNYIELNNTGLMEYIKQKFPNYEFIFSSSADLINELTIDIVNAAIDSGEFNLISLPMRFNEDFTFLKAIEGKNKIELTVNSICTCSFEQCNECLAKENYLQYYFSNETQISNCSKLCKYNSKISAKISLEDIKNKYKKIGINHFKLCNYPDTPMGMFDYVYFLADYFLKPEFKEEFIYMMTREDYLHD